MTLERKAGKQAEKSRMTREKLVNASIEVIKEKGFAAASAKDIAIRAGITWGAAQHHFGTKEEILMEILKRSHDRFIQRLSSPGLAAGTLAERAARFVNLMWEHYQEDLYLAAIEIVSGTRGVGFQSAIKPFADEHLEHLRVIFPESEISADRLQEALLFAHFCLTGMATERLLERQDMHVEAHLARCQKVVTAIVCRTE